MLNPPLWHHGTGLPKRTPFLERYITIYDRAFLRVGLAFAVHRSEATGESNEEARQRLMAREALGET